MKEQSIVWKVLAIIFMVLFTLETIVFIWLWSIGIESIRQEDKCAAICSTDARYGAYSYDSFSDICYCVTPNNKYVVQAI